MTKQREGWGLVTDEGDAKAVACDLEECNDTDDFPLGPACDLSDDGTCESCT